MAFNSLPHPCTSSALSEATWLLHLRGLRSECERMEAEITRLHRCQGSQDVGLKVPLVVGMSPAPLLPLEESWSGDGFMPPPDLILPIVGNGTWKESSQGIAEDGLQADCAENRQQFARDITPQFGGKFVGIAEEENGYHNPLVSPLPSQGSPKRQRTPESVESNGTQLTPTDHASPRNVTPRSANSLSKNGGSSLSGMPSAADIAVDCPSRGRASVVFDSKLATPWQELIHYLLLHPAFDFVIGILIVCNAITIGLEAQNAKTAFMPENTIIITVAEQVFKIVFTVELCLRFYAYGPRNALQSSWVRFDSVVVLSSLMETAVFVFTPRRDAGEGTKVMKDMASYLLILRIFRLARLARAVRLLIQFRTLWLLIRGLGASVMTVVWTFCLICTLTYIFAVLGMETIPPPAALNDYPETLYDEVALANFGSMGAAMLTLLQALTLDSIAGIYRPLISEAGGIWSIWNASYFVTYMLFLSITCMNLVTAIMVDASMAQAAEDKESLRAWEDQKKKALLPKLRNMFAVLDADGSGEVSLDELMGAPEELMDDLKSIAKSDDLVEIFRLMDSDDSGSVNIDEFLDIVLEASQGNIIQKLQMRRIVQQCDVMMKATTAANAKAER